MWVDLLYNLYIQFLKLFNLFMLQPESEQQDWFLLWFGLAESSVFLSELYLKGRSRKFKVLASFVRFDTADTNQLPVNSASYISN